MYFTQFWFKITLMINNYSLGILVAFIGLGLAAVVYFINARFRQLGEKGKDDEGQKMLLEWLRSMQTSLDETRKTINESMRAGSADVTKVLQENSKQLNERLDKAAEVIGGVQKNLGVMQEASIYLKDLHQLLQAPKLRGNIGEHVLYDLL